MIIEKHAELGLFVSTCGKVFKELKQNSRNSKNSKYPYISTNGKNYSVHRLVAQTFLKNEENKPCVCHLDDDPTNSSLNNLFWGTHLENSHDALIKGRFVKNRLIINMKRNSEIYNMHREGKKMLDLSKKFGISESRVSQICREEGIKDLLGKKNI